MKPPNRSCAHPGRREQATFAAQASVAALALAVSACDAAVPPDSDLSDPATTIALPRPAGAPAAVQIESDAARRAADEWYLPVGGGCRLYVREFGIGDTVVVVHGGFGAEHSYLLDAVAGLEDRFHFVFYDQRGSLRSPCPDSSMSVDAHVADIEQLRAALGLERVSILGHSMGTFLAMAYLAEHPDRAGSMALLGPMIPRTPEGEEENSLYQEEQRDFVAWATAQAERRIAAEQLDRPDSLLSARERTHKWRIGYASGNIYHIERWRLVKGGQAFYDADAGQAAARTMGNWNFTGELNAHPFSITMVLGDHDLVGFGGRLHRRLLAGLTDVALIILPDAGHNAWIDHPAAVRRIIAHALGTTPPER
jgi:proline iminopeptidase